MSLAVFQRIPDASIAAAAGKKVGLLLPAAFH